jgi:recombination protein U
MTSNDLRRIRGAQARQAGATFELFIRTSCQYFKTRGLAHIEKTPEPMRPLSAPNGRGQFLAYYEKQAQPDFQGTLRGGRSIVFEAKHTDGDRIERSRLSDEQMDALKHHNRLGADAFVLVSMGLQRFYKVPWPIWDHMKQRYGRQYMKAEDLQPFEVPAISGFIRFLPEEADQYGKHHQGITP